MPVIAEDPYDNNERTAQDASASDGFAVTPSDTDELEIVTRQLWIRGAGDITVVFKSGRTKTYLAVAAGEKLNIRVKQVKLTGTTATNIEAFV